MSRPWDNEATPLTDDHAFYEKHTFSRPDGKAMIIKRQSSAGIYVEARFARDLERRLRHAEWLLERLIESWEEEDNSRSDLVDALDPVIADTYAHLAAAKEEGE